MCVALSFALSYIKLFEMPQGGSVTLFSMLPIMLFSYIYGMKKGLLVGVIYGLLQAVQDPYIIHPAQFLLD
ncbi:MAG: energy-coupled thiamine transporter ThiT, partial [Clostridia bacterium]|nr:energy-coupled thiamine transporter ThiT [Clostridia bacterium]